MPGETGYVSVDGAQVAYRVVGDGGLDVVYVAPFANLETRSYVPRMQTFLDRLATFARVILFDRRGTGVSDPVQIDRLPGWERWTDDLGAVLDAVGSPSPTLFAEFQAGQWAALFAATHPGRASALVLWNSFARSTRAGGHPHGLPPEVFADVIDGLEATWGVTAGVQGLNPTLSPDEAAAHAWYQRTCLTPQRFAAFSRYELACDTRHVLPSIQVPTLVLQRAQHSFLDASAARYLANAIPGARYVEVPGSDSDLWAEGMDATLDLVEEFLTGASPDARSNRVLSTVLFTDIVASTERAAAIGDRAWRALLDEHDRVSRREIERCRGRLIKSTGDGLLATFDSPTRAALAANGLQRSLRELGVDIRAGIHTGEVELRGADVGGLGVHIAARIAAAAGSGEVLASRTVKDLVVGSGLSFVDRGTHRLKGIDDEWQLLALSAS